MPSRVWIVPLLAVLGVACKCGPSVAKVPPSLKITPLSVDFGPVKVGSSGLATIKLESQQKSAVTILAVRLANGGQPGGASDFKVVKKPDAVEGLTIGSIDLSFNPVAVQASEAVLTVESDDPDHPSITVQLSGQGK